MHRFVRGALIIPMVTEIAIIIGTIISYKKLNGHRKSFILTSGIFGLMIGFINTTNFFDIVHIKGIGLTIISFLSWILFGLYFKIDVNNNPKKKKKLRNWKRDHLKA